MAIRYIYDPKQVSEILEKFIYLKEKLADPKKEGEPSRSFPRARKSAREIYRILSNQHFRRLEELLNDLDLCLSKGWEQPSLISTRSSEQFNSHVSELLIAAHFVKLNFAISSFDQLKGQESVREFLVMHEGLSCSCEVYRPRDWNGLELFLDELRLNIKNIDVPWDFRFQIKLEAISQKGKLAQFDPRRFSDEYERPRARANKLGPFVSRICRMLEESSNREFVIYLDDKPLNAITKLSISEIQRSQQTTPNRRASVNQPCLTGFAPEKMFERLLQYRLRNKMREKQAAKLGDKHIKAMFVERIRS